ncbi:MAG: hypothetical protein HUJ30_04695 [Gammaproteobacteria bacterium]|nr:hypothetical protein [Gammaproteobacteria bacterium]
MISLPKVFIDDHGIFNEYHYDTYISQSCAMFVAKARNELSRIKRPLLVEFEHLTGFQEETRTMPLEVVLKSVNSLACCVDPNTEEGNSTRNVIDRYFNLTQWPIPVQVFHDRDEAIDWLRQYLP